MVPWGPLYDLEVETVNTTQLKGKWTQLKGKVREKWGRLTDDDLDIVQGNAEQLAGKLQERYGYQREQAQREVNEFCKSCD
jgi:uncharacterized protein YjbJ (UPF0337 family)